MTGVEILATEEVAVAFGFNWLAFFLTIIICAFLGLVKGWRNRQKIYRGSSIYK